MLTQAVAAAVVRRSGSRSLGTFAGDSDLGHLECDVTAVADDLCADLDQLLLKARQRPVLIRLRRRQRAQEVAEIVGERMELKPLAERPGMTAAST